MSVLMVHRRVVANSSWWDPLVYVPSGEGGVAAIPRCEVKPGTLVQGTCYKVTNDRRPLGIVVSCEKERMLILWTHEDK